MNKSLRWASLVSLLLIAILLANLTWVQAFQQDHYANNDFNRRQIYRAEMIARGQISAGGDVLAHSVADANGRYHREYGPTAYLYGPTLGYLSNQLGITGLEASQNTTLNQENSIKLTIDPAVQAVAYSQLVEPGYEGAAVAVKASTGEILAMASSPSYDPVTVEDNWEELSADERSPLLNHASQDTLPPGSTFKVITAATALMNGYTPSSPLTGAAVITLPGTDNVTLENYGGSTCGGGGTVTLTQAFAYSCNTAFATIGGDLDAGTFEEMATKFGIGEEYPNLGIPTSAGSLGDVTDTAARAQSAIGQRDVTVSALQNAMVAATIANKGLRMKPYLVAEVDAPDLSVRYKAKPQEAADVIPADVAGQVRELMLASERNTWGFTDPTIASKTGTAEWGTDSRKSAPHAWYIAFQGDVAVAVVVKNGGNLGQAATGGQVASPVARAILAAARGHSG
ncbi:MAG: penicillin-binding transpeptidase domain-containing protein [Corynebacterium sp.]|nr:penicillin-binding transpeptidase domain-containing protein [Corynebacterium sp.]